MKTIQILGTILLLLTSAHGQTSLVNAGRFIHLRTVDEGEQDDTYYRAETIDLVAVFRSNREVDKERPFKVRITTRILKSFKENGPESWTTGNRADEIDCISREEADKIATAIVTACSGDDKEKKAEPASTGQSAIEPADKAPGSLSELEKAIAGQTTKVEERGKALEAMVKAKDLVDRGSGAAKPSKTDNSDADEAIRKGLAHQDYIDAKRDYETDQELLRQMKLKLISEKGKK